MAITIIEVHMLFVSTSKGYVCQSVFTTIILLNNAMINY